MTDNLWPWISKYAVPAEAQLAEGGGPWPQDRFWNCVFATVSVALQVYGYPDLEPEDLRQLVQPGTHQGADFAVVAAYLQNHPDRWPNLPPIQTYNPLDTIAEFSKLLAAGYLVIFDAWDDGNGVLLDHKPPQGYSHAVILEAQGPTKTTVWNPWFGEQAGQTFDKTFMRAATLGATGNLMVFARSVIPPPPNPAPSPGPGEGAGTEGPFGWLLQLIDALARIFGLRR
jgi:hypothetical protein